MNSLTSIIRIFRILTDSGDGTSANPTSSDGASASQEASANPASSNGTSSSQEAPANTPDSPAASAARLSISRKVEEVITAEGAATIEALAQLLKDLVGNGKPKQARDILLVLTQPGLQTFNQRLQDLLARLFSKTPASGIGSASPAASASPASGGGPSAGAASGGGSPAGAASGSGPSAGAASGGGSASPAAASPASAAGSPAAAASGSTPAWWKAHPAYLAALVAAGAVAAGAVANNETQGPEATAIRDSHPNPGMAQLLGQIEDSNKKISFLGQLANAYLKQATPNTQGLGVEGREDATLNDKFYQELIALRNQAVKDQGHMIRGAIKGEANTHPDNSGKLTIRGSTSTFDTGSEVLRHFFEAIYQEELESVGNHNTFMSELRQKKGPLVAQAFEQYYMMRRDTRELIWATGLPDPTKADRYAPALSEAPVTVTIPPTTSN